MQRINFYSSELLPKRERLDFRFSLLTLSVFALLLVLVTLYWRNQLQQERLNSQAARENLQTVLDQISQISTLPLPDARPVDIDHLRLRLAQQKKLLASLAQQDWSQRGFSDLLNTLSEQAEPNIWLTSIALDAQAVQLKGATLSPEKIPDWLARLQQQPALQHVIFAQLQLLRNDQKPIIQFDVKTGAMPSMQGGAP